MIAICSKCHFAGRTDKTDPKRVHKRCKVDGQRCDFHLHSEGPGDWLASLLAVCGATKSRVTRFLRWLRILPRGVTCGCEKRQATLNKWFSWLKGFK